MFVSKRVNNNFAVGSWERNIDERKAIRFTTILDEKFHY